MTQTKKRPAKKATAPQRPKELEDMPEEAVDLDAMEEPDSGPFEVFRLKGKVYSIPQRPNAAQALKAMWLTKQVGEDEAAAQMVQELLGEELMAVLMDYPKFNLKMLDQVTKRVMGAMFTVEESEDASGN
jgi:hypothetical protein